MMMDSVDPEEYYTLQQTTKFRLVQIESICR